jgi:hypothetical protein
MSVVVAYVTRFRLLPGLLPVFCPSRGWGPFLGPVLDMTTIYLHHEPL